MSLSGLTAEPKTLSKGPGVFGLLFSILVLLLSALASLPSVPPADEYQGLRKAMVEGQIIARGITDRRVIQALREVPRHLFVPPEQVSRAYEDNPVPIGWGQTISQPFIVAFMTQAVNLERTSRVLEVGTGSGYQAAILARICDEVYSVEIVPELNAGAAAVLDRLGYSNIKLKTGDGYLGWPEYSPFDAIIVTCSPTHVPPALIRQLAENGRMIIPVDENGYQELVLLKKEKGRLTRRSVLPVRFVPMVDANKKIR